MTDDRYKELVAEAAAIIPKRKGQNDAAHLEETDEWLAEEIEGFLSWREVEQNGPRFTEIRDRLAAVAIDAEKLVSSIDCLSEVIRHELESEIFEYGLKADDTLPAGYPDWARTKFAEGLYRLISVETYRSVMANRPEPADPHASASTQQAHDGARVLHAAGHHLDRRPELADILAIIGMLGDAAKSAAASQPQVKGGSRNAFTARRGTAKGHLVTACAHKLGRHGVAASMTDNGALLRLCRCVYEAATDERVEGEGFKKIVRKAIPHLRIIETSLPLVRQYFSVETGDRSKVPAKVQEAHKNAKDSYMEAHSNLDRL